MATVEDAYPIVQTITLSAPERRRIFGDRRNPGEVPHAGPNEVLVVTVNGQSTVLQAKHFRGNEDEIIEATAISVVDISDPRIVSIELTLPSASPSDDFKLTVGFECRVTNAAEVVKRGVTDLHARLENYLSSYPEISNIGQDYNIGQLAQVRREVAATLQPVADLDPLTVPGMKVAMKSWRVTASVDHIEFSQSHVSIERETKLAQLRREAEARKVYAQAQASKILRDEFGDVGADKEYETSLRENMTPAEAAQRVADRAANREETRYQRAREIRQEQLQDARDQTQWEHHMTEVEGQRDHDVQLRVLDGKDKDRDRAHEVNLRSLESSARDRDREHEIKLRELEGVQRDQAWRQQARVDILRIMAERGNLDLHPEIGDRVVEGLLEMFEPSGPALQGRPKTEGALPAADADAEGDDAVAPEDI